LARVSTRMPSRSSVFSPFADIQGFLAVFRPR
jgi:hypothetical protein